MDIMYFVQKILENKNDLNENTFFYKLHEEQVFDFDRLEELIGDIECCIKILKETNICEIEEKITNNLVNTLFFILSSTYKSIIYNYNKNDLYKINEFANGLEENMIDEIELLNESINKLCNILIINNGVRRNGI